MQYFLGQTQSEDEDEIEASNFNEVIEVPSSK
jgi:hypothetical protein